MYQPTWHSLLRTMMQAENNIQTATPQPQPSLSPAAEHDLAYVQAHPELIAPSTEDFYFDRAPFPAEWDTDLTSDCFVRVFAINAWTVVRTLHNADGRRVNTGIVEAGPVLT